MVAAKETDMRMEATWSQENVFRPIFINIKENPQTTESAARVIQFLREYWFTGYCLKKRCNFGGCGVHYKFSFCICFSQSQADCIMS